MHPSACALPVDAATIAEIERRILEPRPSPQAPALRAARRRFLELHELLAAGQSRGGPKAQRDLLVSQARALRLPETGLVLDTGIGRLAAHSAGSPTPGNVGICIEDKRAAVARMPGLSLLPSGPCEQDVVSAQCALLSAHAQCIGELTAEAELLAALGGHAADHPIYGVARGLERYFGGLIDSLSLKLQIIAAEMYHTLYPPEVLQAAERLRSVLCAREAELAKEQSTLDERLAIYRDAGSEFQEIASAYSAVLRDADQIRRDIARVSQL
ncbi:hypothetical protein H4S02_006683 [Coemansia sp. RSA 2611]|nr:hypothetical protein H4S02_006683 [Coemansia sp. RSA 2611]